MIFLEPWEGNSADCDDVDEKWANPSMAGNEGPWP